MVSLKDAKERLANVESVKEWNEIRDTFKDEMNPSDLAELDSSGYIVELLGTDSDRKRKQELQSNQ